MAPSLDCVEHVIAGSFPVHLVGRPRRDLSSFTESPRDRPSDDVAGKLARSAFLERAQQEPVLESAAQYLETQRRKGTGIRQDAVAIAPVGSTFRSLVERDGVDHHVRRASVVVAIGKVESLPGVPK